MSDIKEIKIKDENGDPMACQFEATNPMSIETRARLERGIGRRIGPVAMLGQLAEECNELAKASLKYQRILIGTNPTPVTVFDAISDITEEATDVQDCLEILASTIDICVFDRQQSAKKLDRWIRRLNELDTKNNKN